MTTPVHLYAVDCSGTARTRTVLTDLQGRLPHLVTTTAKGLTSTPRHAGHVVLVFLDDETLPEELTRLAAAGAESDAWVLIGPETPALIDQAEQSGYVGCLSLEDETGSLARAIRAFQRLATRTRDQTLRSETLATTNERLERVFTEQTELAAHTGSVDQYLGAVTQAVLRLTPADGAALGEVEGNELIYRAAAGSAADQLGARLGMDNSLSGYAVRRREFLNCPDTQADPRVAHTAARQLGIRSMLVAPLPTGNGALGTIKATAPVPHAFDELDAQIIRLLANQLAGALVQARAEADREALVYNHRHALEGLQRTTLQWRALVNSSPLPIVGTDRAGRVTLWNTAAERLFGWSAAEAVGSPAPYVPADVREHFQHYRQRVLEGETVHVDSQRLTRDGRILDVRVFASPLVGSDDSVEGVVAQVEDISSRLSMQRALQRAYTELERRVDTRTAERDQRTAALQREARERAMVERRLETSERRFQSIFVNAGVGIALTARDGRFLEVNDELCRILGFDREELLRCSFRDITHSEDLEKDLEQARRLHAGDIGGYHMEKRYLRRDGTPLWVSLNASVIHGEDGDVREIVTVVTDIQARKSAEQRLRLFERAVEASVDGIVISDALAPDQPVIYANPALETITGYPLSATVGRNCRFLQGNDRDQRALNRLRRNLAEGRESRVVLRNYRQDGARFYNELHVAPIRDSTGRITHQVGVINDITARLEAEQALQRANEALERRVNERTLELAQALDEIRDNEAKLRGVAETVPGVLFQWFARRDGTTGFYYVSPRCEELYGISAEALMADWRNLPIHPDDWPGVLESIDEAVRNGTPWFNESRILHTDGSVRWLRSRSRPVLDTPEETVFAGVIIDATAEVEARRALEGSERRFRRLAEGSLQGIVVHRMDEALTLLFVNTAAARMYGFESPREALSYGSVRPFVPEAVQAEAEASWRRLLEGTLPHIHARIPAHTRQGAPITVELMGCLVEWDHAPALQLTLIDVTERDRMETELRRLASTDALTGMANRRQFLVMVEQALAQARRHGAPVSVLLLDIDRFKGLNDTYGHEAGDRALQHFASVLRETLRASDLACRWGGEEFGVLATDAATAGGCNVGERIRRACESTRLDYEGHGIRFTVSIGVAVVADDEHDIQPALRRADTALYAAKRGGRNQVVYTPPDGGDPRTCDLP